MSISRFVTRPIARAISKSILGEGSGFNPLSLFTNGEQGAWYDPSDLTTLFQDDAGTTPVTADGDPVGLMLDKSGNDNHVSQSVAASRPIYRTDGTYHWLEFDGVDDELTSTISPAVKSTAYAASVVGSGVFLGAASPRSYFGEAVNGAVFMFSSDGNISAPIADGAHVLSARFFSDERFWIDGALAATAASSGDVGGFGTDIIIGRRDGFVNNTPANGGLYGMILSDDIWSDTDRSSVDAYLAAKSGVTL